ncbi:hypothetical protein MUK42_27578 [Musa troglodytarum]|uniref:Uncharacterized protein n=1 Tax=Musa troglodytarum TaxID=320322 RepID=A0A9E7EJM5_9LILI|nr:hypothetical protein MUK42_27578 [Musa troglodytarum]
MTAHGLHAARVNLETHGRSLRQARQDLDQGAQTNLDVAVRPQQFPAAVDDEWFLAANEKGRVAKPNTISPGQSKTTAAVFHVAHVHRRHPQGASCSSTEQIPCTCFAWNMFLGPCVVLPVHHCCRSKANGNGTAYAWRNRAAARPLVHPHPSATVLYV